MNALVIPAGEPNLVVAILQASRFGGAGYVHRYDGVEGWHVGSSVPRDVPAYFRVFANLIHVRSADRVEHYFGKIVDGQIIQERG